VAARIRVLEDLQDVEPLLRRVADHEIVMSAACADDRAREGMSSGSEPGTLV